MPGPFLESWVATHVKPASIPAADGAQKASELAAACIADAAMCGIFIDDLEEAAGGSVLKYMIKVISDGTLTVHEHARADRSP